MTHVVDSAIVDGVQVDKSGVRSMMKNGLRFKVASVADVQSGDYSAYWGIEIGAVPYDRSNGSVLSHDGVQVLVDSVGTRFIRAATTLYAGLNPRGEWNSGTTYAKNDSVSLDGTSYVSRVDSNTNNSPDSSPTQWQVLSVGTPGEDGAPGQGLDFDVQVADIAARAAHDDEEVGFRVLVTDTGDGRAAVYQMGAGGSADWGDAIYVTGEAGADGADGAPGADGADGVVQTVVGQHSLSVDSTDPANPIATLVNDTASPGNNKVYGTDASGVRGWKDDPAAGSANTVDETLTFEHPTDSGREFEISTRDAVTTFPVPFFRPATINSAIAVDIMPNGTATDTASRGVAWLDICNADCADTQPAMACLGLTAGLTELAIGSYEYNTGTLLPINFKMDGTTYATFATDGTWKFTTAASFGVPLTMEGIGGFSGGPYCNIFHNTGTPADNDTVGGYGFQGKNDAAETVYYALLDVIAVDVSDGTEGGRIRFRTNIAGSLAERMSIGHGVTIGSATGGDKGAGTLNVSGDIYKNNTAYTNPDYVFEHHYTGKIERFAKNEGAASYTGRLPLDELRAYTKDNLRLPGISDSPMGMFERGDKVLEKLEELTLYILDLHERIEALEPGKN
jgi:hypothetical protein